MIEKLLDWYKILKGSRHRRHWVYAYVIVPGAVVSYTLSGLSPVSPFKIFEDGVSIVPIKAVNDTATGIKEESGLVVILDPSELELSIPWTSSASKPNRLLMSLDSDSFRGNTSRLTMDAAGLRAQLPLLGISEPVVLIALGGPANDVLFPGKKVSVNSLGLSARSSVALALWGIIASMFGIGLSIGIANAPISEPEEE